MTLNSIRFLSFFLSFFLVRRIFTDRATGASTPSRRSAHSSQLASRPLSAQISQQLLLRNYFGITSELLRNTASAIQSQLDRLETQMESMACDIRCCICLIGNHDSQLLPCMHNKFCKACCHNWSSTFPETITAFFAVLQSVAPIYQAG